MPIEQLASNLPEKTIAPTMGTEQSSFSQRQRRRYYSE